MDVQLMNLAVEGLISMNQKRKSLWQTYLDITTEVTENVAHKSPDAKKKSLASNDKLDLLLFELNTCQTDFWSHLDSTTCS